MEIVFRKNFLSEIFHMHCFMAYGTKNEITEIFKEAVIRPKIVVKNTRYFYATLWQIFRVVMIFCSLMDQLLFSYLFVVAQKALVNYC